MRLALKATFLYTHHAFSFFFSAYIPLPSLHDYAVKRPKFTFYEVCEHETTI